MKDKTPFSLLNSIKQAFAPPVFSGDEDKPLQAKVLSVLLLSLVAFLCVGLIVNLFFFVNKFGSGVMLGIMCTLVLTSYTMLQRGRVLIIAGVLISQRFTIILTILSVMGLAILEKARHVPPQIFPALGQVEYNT